MEEREIMKRPRSWSCRQRRKINSSVVLFLLFLMNMDSSIAFLNNKRHFFYRSKQRRGRISLGASTFSPSPSSSEGLSKFHQSILSRTLNRQRFVTGRYPLTVTVAENPTRKWLQAATIQVLVNGTMPSCSLASLDRLHWLDDEERSDLLESYAMVSLELIAEVHMERPGYLQILPSDGAGSTAALCRNRIANAGLWKQRRKNALQQQIDDIVHQDRLWATGFSLAGRQGLVKCVDGDSGHISSVNERTANAMLWPNEVHWVPTNLLGSSSSQSYRDALLVSDGFLVPGKDRGGIYVVQNPGNPDKEWTVCLTASDTNSRWFYHRAVWVDLTGDGRQSILTARCKVSAALGNNAGVTSGITQQGELVWLECPQPHSIDPETGTPLESDGTIFDPLSSRHLPWKEHVLARGPDVMFSVADLDTTDDTVEVMSSQFFGKQVNLHCIQLGPKPRICFSRTIDDRCGTAFGCILADLDCAEPASNRVVIDSGSTVESLVVGDSFSHLLVTSHECSFAESEAAARPQDVPSHSFATDTSSNEGGSLFAYRVPQGKDAWKTEPWIRTTIASGFKVHGQLKNMINPGAPGFVYTFHPKQDEDRRKRPLIAVAGDCAESAYIYRPDRYAHLTNSVDASTRYKLMVEIQCGATVGSIGIGYDDFTLTEQESGYARLYIPCYEKDKILVFALGSGEDDIKDDGW